MLSQKAIEEFKRLYEQKYGVRLNNEQALQKAIALLTVIKTIYRPVPRHN